MVKTTPTTHTRATPVLRLLPAEEFFRLDGIEGFEAIATLDPTRGQVAVLVLEEAEQIRAAWALTLVPHAEPLWVDEATRRRPQQMVQLLDGMQQLLQAHGLEGAVVTTTLAPVEQMLARLGCRAIGQAFIFPVVTTVQ